MDQTTERPIPFKAPMVRAILAGAKTQTRRVVANHPGDAWTHDGFGRITSKHPRQGRFGLFVRRGQGTDFPECDIVPCPYGQPGDRLWVREAWQAELRWDWTPPRDIKAGSPIYFEFNDEAVPACAGKKRPSIHMPRWASRITLEVTRVRVERLQDISEADAEAEGCTQNQNGYFWGGPHAVSGLKQMATARQAYQDLWESINGPGSWDANPWVWVVEFKRVWIPEGAN